MRCTHCGISARVRREQMESAIENLPPVPCPAIDLEKPLIELILEDLDTTMSNQHRVEVLDLLSSIFQVKYQEIQIAFFQSNGQCILESVIRSNASSPEVVLAVLKVFQIALTNPQYLQQVEQNNLIGICINVFLRYEQKRDLVKAALQIIQTLCIRCIPFGFVSP